MRLLKKANHVLSSVKGNCINIGCGQDIRPGWISCDLHPISDSVKRFDITSKNDLTWLAEKKSHIIECNHVIGYLNYTQAYNFFCSCFNSLQNSGKLILEFPDIVKISKKIIEISSSSLNRDEYIELIRAIYAYDYEDAFDEKFDMQTYVFGWSSNFVCKTLTEIGFDKLKIESPKEHSQRDWRDTRIEARKS
jgi:hypothetical protein